MKRKTSKKCPSKIEKTAYVRDTKRKKISKEQIITTYQEKHQ
jgi:hypothetical protein